VQTPSTPGCLEIPDDLRSFFLHYGKMGSPCHDFTSRTTVYLV